MYVCIYITIDQLYKLNEMNTTKTIWKGSVGLYCAMYNL